MDLARIALIAAVCLADGVLLLLWNWIERTRERVSASWAEILARRIGLQISGNRWARGAAMCPPTESVRP
jgi:hypothetical protein